jgi:hypothetical protein
MESSLGWLSNQNPFRPRAPAIASKPSRSTLAEIVFNEKAVNKSARGVDRAAIGNPGDWEYSGIWRSVEEAWASAAGPAVLADLKNLLEESTETSG